MRVADRRLLHGGRRQAEQAQGKEYCLFYDEEVVREGVADMHEYYAELYLR